MTGIFDASPSFLTFYEIYLRFSISSFRYTKRQRFLFKKRCLSSTLCFVSEVKQKTDRNFQRIADIKQYIK